MKRIFVTAFFLVTMSALFSLEVDRNEISVEGAAVEFINYTGPHTEINSIEEIEAIGSSLGERIRQAPADQALRSGGGRYLVIHAVDSSVSEGFDADILVLGEDAEVDHIDNLRRIISSYLSSAYGYSSRDGNTLAIFITVYNAVHRGDTRYFAEKYKDIVTRELSADRAGLALSYTEWAGKSQIVIPLSDPAFSGTLSSVDTTSLTEDEVVEAIKTDESSPQDIRRDMTELREREGDEAQERADEAREEAARAREEAVRLQQEADEAQQEADEARQEAESAAAAAEAEPDSREARRTAQETAAAAEQRQREADDLREQQQEAEERAAEAEERAEREQELADRRQEETAEERRQIASDTQSEIDAAARDRQAAVANSQPVAGLRVTNQGELLSEILLVSAGDGSVLTASALNSIRNRTLLDTGSAFIASAGQGSAVRLVLIDKLTLEVIKESEQEIAAESMLVASNNDYYAVVSRGGSFYLGRFDRDLNLQASSAIQVQPFTAITVTENGIIVQDSSSNLKILRATDLIDLNG